MTDRLLKSNQKISKSHDKKKASPTSNSQGFKKKRNRKRENPVRFVSAMDLTSNHKYSNSWICKNSACRAVLPMDDKFCRWCSCCICRRFDDNKDPSLWLVCQTETEEGDSCGLTCHVECAFQRQRVGVVNPGQYMQLDGNYRCSSCGKVLEILGCWKKQLDIAKDTCRVDVLCYRISLSYRLLKGTLKFKALHEIVKDAKSKLEAEVGPVDRVPNNIGKGIVSMLSVAGDVQNLCADAIKKADEFLMNASNREPNSRVDSVPAPCRFLCQEITPSSIVISVVEIPTDLTDSIKGFKLWYCRSRQEAITSEPLYSFRKDDSRIIITNLQPCTEYTFRIVSYTEAGDLGCCEAKCFTKSVDTIHKKPVPSSIVGFDNQNPCIEGNYPGTKVNSKGIQEANGSLSGFSVGDHDKVFVPIRSQPNGCLQGFCNTAVPETTTKFQAAEVKQSPPPTRDLDLNVVSVPDLNEDATLPIESPRGEENGCTLERAVGADDDAATHGTQKNNFQANFFLRGSSSPNEDIIECDSNLINGSSFRNPGRLDENFEECVKTIRWLECKGHIEHNFRLKFLTWFSLRSTTEERRVVNTFIRALADDAKSLAGQLADSFSDIISYKKTKHSDNCDLP